jgi:hypothetical protein
MMNGLVCRRNDIARGVLGKPADVCVELVSPNEACIDDGASGAWHRSAFLSEANTADRHCHIPFRQSFRQPICELDEACLTGDRLRLDRLPATATTTFLTPVGYAAIPLPLTKVAVAALHLVPALSGAVRSSPVCATAIEAAMGAARTREKE